LIDGNQRDTTGLDLREAAVNLCGPGLFNLGLSAKACEQMVCEQCPLFGRSLSASASRFANCVDMAISGATSAMFAAA
jgi:hypothetical protein